MFDFHRIRDPEHDECLRQLLLDSELTLPLNTDGNLGLYENGELIGCGFLKGNMIQGLTIARSRQGENLSTALVCELIRLAAGKGITYLNVFTKPPMARLLSGIGLRLVADASPYAVFLEYGPGGIAEYTNRLKKLAERSPFPSACLVMNCNPFTKGHRYLIEKACSENAWTWLLVVEENLSVFPFSHRIRMIREETEDIGNICVLPGGPYVISTLTFPVYFTRDIDLASAQGAMDASVFAQVIAPALGIQRRYIGTEPLSASTALYNRALKERLPLKGIDAIEIERANFNGKIISASRVREALKNELWDEVRNMVPDTTYRYLISEEAREPIERIKSGLFP